MSERSAERVAGFTDTRFLLDHERVLVGGREIQSYPGKRLVLHGHIEGHGPVVAKFYLGRLRGWWEWFRGLQGTRALIASGVPTPELIFAGFQQDAGAWLTVVNHVTPDRPWPPDPDGDRMSSSLDEAHDLLLATLARLHEAGLVQNDLNWTNFIPSGNTLYAIDGDRVRQFPAPLGRSPSLANLQRLYAYKADFRQEHIGHGYRRYCEHRDWMPAERELHELLVAVHRQRRRVGDRFVRRSLAGWKYFQRERTDQWRVIRDQRRMSRPALDRVLMAAVAGSSDTVIETADGPRRIRDFDAVSDGVSARVAWSRALLFRRLRIPAEQPAALLESTRLMGGRRGRVVTCARPARGLMDALGDAAWLERQSMIHRLGEVLGLIWLANLHLADVTVDDWAVDDAGIMLLRPERSRHGHRRARPDLPAELVQSIAARCNQSVREIEAALWSGVDQAVPGQGARARERS